MATIRKRGEKWQVQVRRNGHQNLSKSFLTKRHAEAWAHETELGLERGELLPSLKKNSTETVGSILKRYRDKATPLKKSASVERYRIGKILRDRLSLEVAVAVTPAQIASYRDRRLSEVATETVRQDLVLLRQVFDVARREWGLPIQINPVDDVRRPEPAKQRDRRIGELEYRQLRDALNGIRNRIVPDVIEFALATGMRRGEILRVRTSDVDYENSVLRIPITKNGRSRTIPLTPGAIAVLQRRSTHQQIDGTVFPISANAFRLAWQRLVKKTGVKNLRFHDFRHEAISRFFEAGLSL